MNNNFDFLRAPADINMEIAFVLDCESDFDFLFAKRGYSSIQEVIDEADHETHK